MGNKQVVLPALCVCLIAAACARGGCVQLDAAAPLLERPHPMDYPSSAPLPNRVVAELAAGRYDYRRRITNQDFMVYELLVRENRGFVVYGPTVHECR